MSNSELIPRNQEFCGISNLHPNRLLLSSSKPDIFFLGKDNILFLSFWRHVSYKFKHHCIAMARNIRIILNFKYFLFHRCLSVSSPAPQHCQTVPGMDYACDETLCRHFVRVTPLGPCVFSSTLSGFLLCSPAG